jgi:hypothetical protein
LRLAGWPELGSVRKKMVVKVAMKEAVTEKEQERGK